MPSLSGGAVTSHFPHWALVKGSDWCRWSQIESLDDIDDGTRKTPGTGQALRCAPQGAESKGNGGRIS
jgi:hypothetical protein